MVDEERAEKEGLHIIQLRESREFGGNRTGEWIVMQTPAKKRDMGRWVSRSDGRGREGGK